VVVAITSRMLPLLNIKRTQHKLPRLHLFQATSLFPQMFLQQVKILSLQKTRRKKERASKTSRGFF
jgi:hypothetical protein